MQYQPVYQNPADQMCSKVQLFISCRNLKDMDVMSLSDPVCVLY